MPHQVYPHDTQYIPNRVDLLPKHHLGWLQLNKASPHLEMQSEILFSFLFLSFLFSFLLPSFLYIMGGIQELLLSLCSGVTPSNDISA